METKETLAPLAWRPELRRLDTLVPLENNPFGKITQEKRRRLEQKLLELGVFEAASIDTDNVLLTFNKRRNLLMGLGRGEEKFVVMVPNRPLTEDERKKIILASNVNEGEWIDEILRGEYSDMMAEMGISLASIDEVLGAGPEAAPAEKPEYPIVAEFSEKYSAFIIVARNEIDANNVRQILGLEKMQSYKSQEVGNSTVIEASDFAARCSSK